MRILFILLPIFLLANPTLKEVLNFPASYYRDFWITQYLKKTKDIKQAKKLYSLITHKKKTQLRILSKIFPYYKTLYNCKYPTRHNWNKINYQCIIKNGFRLSDLKIMNPEDVKTLLNSITNSKIKTEITMVFNNNYQKAFKDPNIFYDIFLSIAPDIEIPSIYLDNLSSDRRFGILLRIYVRSKRNNLKKSLLNLSENIADKYKFDLAINAIDLKDYNLAVKLLNSKEKLKNRDLFWLYLLTQKQMYANQLLDNKRLDFYTLYIYEEFNKPYQIDKVPIANTAKVKYDINNPLDVMNFYRKKARVKDDFKFASELDNKKEKPLKTLILDRAYKYTKNYYIMPEYNLTDLNVSQKALFYALARQESRFIPAQISKSYAIGLMQMMPFLIKSFNPKVDINSFFKANINVEYAKKHLKWLIRRLQNPLFVSYAYNGGIGFTQRKVMNYFKYKGMFEPFFSIEMVPYSESREYGKKVLTNYIIYRNLLGNKISLHKVLKIEDSEKTEEKIIPKK